MSKALATIATQPLIVAKVGLQSKPPPARQGKPFKGFVEVMEFIIKNEGALSLFKGMGPQILKGLLVQGLLMMTKERYVILNISSSTGTVLKTEALTPTPRMELLFVLLFRYVRLSRAKHLAAAAELAAKAKAAVPLTVK